MRCFLRRRRAHTGSLGTTWLVSTPPILENGKISYVYFFSEIWLFWTPLFTSILAFVRLSIVPLYLPVSRIGGLFPRFGDSGDGAVNSVWQFRSFGSLHQASLNICTVREKGSCQAKGWAKCWVWTYKGRRKGKCLLVWGWKRRPTDTGIAALDGCLPTQHLRCKLKSSTATLHYTT